MEQLHQTLISLPTTVLICYAVLRVYTNDAHWSAMAACVLFASALNELVLKPTFRQARPSARGGKFGCKSYAYGARRATYGMPSGHAITIAS